ncbi:STAS domain-containing protein [candidate division CSSED10-310 bacterium]|uniref:Anti-sigma factor antagonist n=1 Tax=candidate division CSSED10-310 bacterium TaxID=2855610 RepID=A0ABV6YXJ8_UNCC1
MLIYYLRYPQYAIIKIEGHIEGFELDKFRQPFQELALLGCQTIILNFEKINYISSSILGYLIEEWRRKAEKGGKVVVCCLTPKVANLFEITHLFSIIDVYETEEEAIEAIKKG